MNPGRELDALVAEKVMGWKLFHGGIDGPNGEPGCIDSNQIEKHFKELPHYSTSIADAWKVVDKLDLFRAWVLTKYLGYYTVEEVDRDGFGETISKGESAPHTICLAALKLAALKAVGYEIKNPTDR